MTEQGKLPNLVVVHPLVLLSVVDHYNRVVVGSRNKRVVGVLLGNHSFLIDSKAKRPEEHWISPTHLPFHLKKTPGRSGSGSWTICTLKRCLICLRK